MLLAVGSLNFTAQAQETGWRLCNETSFILETATGRSEGNAVIVDGWTRIRPGECRTALPGPLVPGLYFLHARSSSAHYGGERKWGGEIPLCVDTSGSFSVESPKVCGVMGLDSRNFRAVRIENRNRWTTRLLETEPYGLKRSEAAGLQRLLNDAGLADTSVDGYVGRRTRGAIAGFLSANNLPSQMDDAELIDILEEVARNRARQVGMVICNRSANRVWTSIARRRGEGFESRGWWAIEAGGCARTVDDNLVASPHYVYAEMETIEGVRRLSGANEIFCISRSKFAITGRDRCEIRAYREVDFIETAVPEDGRLVVELFERNFDPVEIEGG